MWEVVEGEGGVGLSLKRARVEHGVEEVVKIPEFPELTFECSRKTA